MDIEKDVDRIKRYKEKFEKLVEKYKDISYDKFIALMNCK